MATPHPMHLANALLALEHNKPVLVEKAFTMTGAQARELVATARARGLFLMEAMWTRFLPHVVAIRELLAQGVLGEIVSVMADHGQWFAEDRASRLFAPELGEGPCSISASIPFPSLRWCSVPRTALRPW